MAYIVQTFLLQKGRNEGRERRNGFKIRLKDRQMINPVAPCPASMPSGGVMWTPMDFCSSVSVSLPAATLSPSTGVALVFSWTFLLSSFHIPAITTFSGPPLQPRLYYYTFRYYPFRGFLQGVWFSHTSPSLPEFPLKFLWSLPNPETTEVCKHELWKVPRPAVRTNSGRDHECSCLSILVGENG